MRFRGFSLSKISRFLYGRTHLALSPRRIFQRRKGEPATKEAILDTHRCGSYVYAQMIAGRDATRHGEAKNSWLTGTAAWTFVALSQYILGIRADYEGLIIDPCIPKDWDGFRVTRRFRGTTVHIDVKNPDRRCTGVHALSVNGQAVRGNRIPMDLLKSGESLRVEAVLSGKT